MPFRLYIDESGDHTYNNLHDSARRYLCLTGCIIDYDDNRLIFSPAVEQLKQRHFPYDLDETSVILHRNDLINKRGAFSNLTDPNSQTAFDEDLLIFLRDHSYTLVSVVIDKARHRERYGKHADHPYHRCLEVLLERYCGFLEYFDSVGDVMAEARGRVEDDLLRQSYRHFYQYGSKYGSKVTHPNTPRNTLTSREIKLKLKSANVAGLQIADLLAFPCRQGILANHEVIPAMPNVYGARVWDCIQPKFNRHFGNDRIEGYGQVFICPK